MKYIATNLLRINLDPLEVESLVLFFDDDDSGDLNFGEFVTIIRYIVKALKRGMLDHLCTEPRRALSTRKTFLEFSGKKFEFGHSSGSISTEASINGNEDAAEEIIDFDGKNIGTAPTQAGSSAKVAPFDDAIDQAQETSGPASRNGPGVFTRKRSQVAPEPFPRPQQQAGEEAVAPSPPPTYATLLKAREEVMALRSMIDEAKRIRATAAEVRRASKDPNAHSTFDSFGLFKHLTSYDLHGFFEPGGLMHTVVHHFDHHHEASGAKPPQKGSFAESGSIDVVRLDDGLGGVGGKALSPVPASPMGAQGAGPAWGDKGDDYSPATPASPMSQKQQKDTAGPVAIAAPRSTSKARAAGFPLRKKDTSSSVL